MMRISLLALPLALGLIGCTKPITPEQNQELEVLRIQNQVGEEKIAQMQQKTRQIEADTERVKAAQPTPEQQEKTEALTHLYFVALAKTVASIDDHSSPPNVIAKAAVAANYDLLFTRTSAQFAHISQASSVGAAAVTKRLKDLPFPSDIDDAVYMVLRLRKAAQEATPSEDDQPNLGPYKGPLPKRGSPTSEITI